MKKDINQRAKAIVDMATNPPAFKEETSQQKAGRLGGLKGGKARAATTDMKKLGKKGAKARWGS